MKHTCGRSAHGARRGMLAAATLLAWLLCARAHAYQDPTRFAAPVDTGGGGGRFFTGSPGDAYTCKVCHSGGVAVHLQISGLPLEGYVPGQAYRISVAWPAGLKAASANFEITDDAGHPFGQFAMPNPADLGETDLCVPTARGLPDVFVFPMEMSPRMVATALDCGGSRATVDWIAPMPGAGAQDVRGAGTAHFNGSFVASNMDGTVAGDDVTDFARAINPAPTAAPAARKVAGSCSATSGNAGRGANLSAPYVLSAIGFASLALRRRRARGASHARAGENRNGSAHCSD